MDYVKKYGIQSLCVLIIAIYFFSRFYNLLQLPIFTDEAIYLRWAQIAKDDAAWRFISLTDGKQPSFVWLTSVALRFFDDPLFAGRIVSIVAGFMTLIGLFFLGRELFKNTWVGVLASALYLIYPMALVYDRIALYDSLVSACMIWALYFQVLLIRRVRLDIALILGMVMGAGMLTKTNAFFSLPFLPVTLLLFHWKQSAWKTKFIQWCVFAGVAAGMGIGFYSVLRLSPFFHIIAEKNAVFAYPFSEWIRHPFTYFTSNLRGLFDWLAIYMTWPVLILVIFSFVASVKTNVKQFVTDFKILSVVVVIDIVLVSLLFFAGTYDMLTETIPFIMGVTLIIAIILAYFRNKEFFIEKLVLILWFVIPFVYLAFFGNTIYPRFFFFMTMPLLLLAAYSLFILIRIIQPVALKVAVPVVLIMFMLYADFMILTNFSNAPIPKSDLHQYNNDWPSGVGIKESIVFFEEQAKTQKIFIATQGTFGLLPYAYELYLLDNPNITIKAYWPIEDIIPEEVRNASRLMPTYFVFYQPCVPCRGKGIAPASWSVTPVLTIQKTISDAFFTVYQVNGQ